MDGSGFSGGMKTDNTAYPALAGVWRKGQGKYNHIFFSFSMVIFLAIIVLSYGNPIIGSLMIRQQATTQKRYGTSQNFIST